MAKLMKPEGHPRDLFLPFLKEAGLLPWALSGSADPGLSIAIP